MNWRFYSPNRRVQFVEEVPYSEFYDPYFVAHTMFKNEQLQMQNKQLNKEKNELAQKLANQQYQQQCEREKKQKEKEEQERLRKVYKHNQLICIQAKINREDNERRERNLREHMEESRLKREALRKSIANKKVSFNTKYESNSDSKQLANTPTTCNEVTEVAKPNVAMNVFIGEKQSNISLLFVIMLFFIVSAVFVYMASVGVFE